MDRWLIVLLVLMGLALAGYLIRRLLMWMAGRGWIYYGNSPGARSAGALAALEIAAFLEPETEHVIEEIRSQSVRREQSETGEEYD